MKKEIVRIRNRIGICIFFVMGIAFLWTTYKVLGWSFDNVYAVRDDGSLDRSFSFFGGILLIVLLLSIFASISIYLQEMLLQMILQKKFPTVNTYKILQEGIFLDASFFMKQRKERTDLQILIDKIKKRNIDVETSFLSSLHKQSVEKLNCSICEKEIKIMRGKIIVPCTCKSIENYEKNSNDEKTTNKN